MTMPAVDFKDLFSKQASHYSKHRPSYPRDLFVHLASLTSGHALALDVATGNGQAARSLAEFYKNVIATDASESQLAEAPRDLPNVTYKHLRAEMTDDEMRANAFEPHSFDLIAVATGVHWFDHAKFYEVVRKLLIPREGVLAVWCLSGNIVWDSEEVGVVHRKFAAFADKYFAPELAKYVYTEYRTLPFPFDEVDTTSLPPFVCEMKWTLEEYLGYLRSWSSVQTFIEQHGHNPLDGHKAAIIGAWGPPETKRTLTFPIFMRVGRVKE